MNVTLYHGDCLVELARVPDRSVHLIATDLPYGTTQAPWDSAIPLAPLWKHFKRVLTRNGAVVLTASQPFTSTLVMSNPRWFRYDWVWEKSNMTGFLNAKRRPLKAHESVLVFYARQPTYNPQKWQIDPRFVDRRQALNPKKTGTVIYGEMTTQERKADDGSRYPLSVLSVSNDKGLHPTQKPLALMEYMIATYSNPGDVVLDCTMGSGTTGEAAANLNRAFIGCELRADYFEIAQERIEEALARARQLPLAG